MDLIERNNNLKKVDKYLRDLFRLALSQNSKSSAEEIQKTVEKIMQSLKVVTVSEREFVVSKGLFEINFKIYSRQPVELYIRKISLQQKAVHYLKELKADRNELEVLALGTQGFLLPPFLDKSIATVIALLEIAYRTISFPGLNAQMRIFLESKSEDNENSSSEYFELKFSEA